MTSETQNPTHSGELLLDVQNLHVSFGQTQVLHGVDLQVQAGERVAIVGQSGSGKSTVIAAVLGLLAGSGRVTDGSIRLDTGSTDDAGNPRGEAAFEELTELPESGMRRIRGNRIGLVPQDPSTNLNPSMKVGAQVADALRAHGMRDKQAINNRVVELMTEAGIPEARRRAGQFPHEFSGGMRQRILIAIALAREPQLIIADEPTSALDVTVQRVILDHIQSLVDERGTSLLFITHDLGVAADRCDRVIVMLNGQIVEQGDPQQILTDPQHEYTRKLIDAAPTLSSAKALSQAGTVTESQEGQPTEDAILVVENLVKEYRLRGTGGGILRAVDDVSFSIPRGTTTAVVGESGSGKSTVAKIVLGLEKPTSGTTLIDGMDINQRAHRKILRRRMQPVFQDPYGSLDPTHSLERLIDEPLRIFGIGNKQQRRDRVAELLDHVALPLSAAQKRPGELSGGQRQRVAIARALALEPELIIADEAVSALDVLVQDQILELLVDLQNRLGLSYLFITHDLAVARELAHHALVMQKGKLVEHGTVDEVFLNPQQPYTQDLLEAIPGQSLAA
ncbi:ABC transporter ATP-binding protein [Nesterenkonia sp. MY13]|uniref:ABC transporter ATP-binding protein n=1 Tax=Nesterenkonia sedimenti TaxID=1463632 RepID=A0A7X8TL12_9MICC|nr:ABC transporter ATP-binding protein [Nesterenkonia sedimenti]NLS10307.1 ABC transporter ATP-binding protein [Nesterenkonia sedimenti]